MMGSAMVVATVFATLMVLVGAAMWREAILRDWRATLWALGASAPCHTGAGAFERILAAVSP